MSKKERWRGSALAALVLVLVLLFFVPTAQAQEKSLYWERLDVDIEVQADGSFRVTERNYINFTSGTFRFGARSIPTERTTGVEGVEVTVDGQALSASAGGESPGTFLLSESRSSVDLRYFFAQPVTGEHQIDIAYTVEGGLRYYDGGDQLYWKAVHADRPATVENSQVTVLLPPGVIREEMVAAAYFTDAQFEISDDGRTVIFRATESIPPQHELEVRVQFPHGVVSGSAPLWQAQADRRGEEADARAARGRIIDLFGGGFSLLLLVGGLTSAFLVWWRGGRDPEVELVADYLSEPPDDLTAGMVGTLLDENADLQDVMATLLDLARKGAIGIKETSQAKKGWLGKEDPEFAYELLDRSRATTKGEKKLIEEFFGSRSKRNLDDLRHKFYSSLPKIKEALYEDVTDAGLFVANPEGVRGRYTGFGVLLLFGSGLLFCMTFWMAETLASTGIFCIPLSLGVVGLAVIIMAQAMPRKTPKGSQASKKWQAFRRYLENIEGYGDLEAKREIWADYLPFAVAFGLEKEYIKKFAKIGNAPAPYWYSPYGHHGGYHHRRGRYGSDRDQPTSEGDNVQDSFSGQDGGIQGMSDSMSLGLQGMSDGLAIMLSSTASTLTSTPPSESSGGGGGGGGFSGGGFSGGGGGGGGGSSSFG